MGRSTTRAAYYARLIARVLVNLTFFSCQETDRIVVNERNAASVTATGKISRG